MLSVKNHSIRYSIRWNKAATATHAAPANDFQRYLILHMIIPCRACGIEVEKTSAMSSVQKPLTVQCQCGNISFPTPTAQHIDLFHCHCTECRKQSASAYGTSVIFTAEGLFPLEEELRSKLTLYTRKTDKGGLMDCYFCSTCGSRMFHRITSHNGEPGTTVSIKGGCIEGLDWTGGKHIFVRSAVVEISSESEQYDAEPHE